MDRSEATKPSDIRSWTGRTTMPVPFAPLLPYLDTEGNPVSSLHDKPRLVMTA